MQTTQRHPARPTLAATIAALVCGALAVGGALTVGDLSTTESGGPVITITPSDPGWWLLIAIIGAQVTLLLWASQAPRVVLIAVATIPFLHAIIIPGGTFSLVTVAVSIAVFWAVVRRPLRGLVVVLPLAVLLVGSSQSVNDVSSGALLDLGTLAAAMLQALTVIVVPLVIGLFFAARADARVSRANEIAAVKGERDALIQAAISQERIAMSRELHDIAAHHMSGIALLASAIYRQVDLDPEAAKISAQQVRAQSKSVLDDLRRVIGLLRNEADDSRAVETLVSVKELVEARLGATLTVNQGDHELGIGIGPLAQLVAYRMVQESLANAAVHAPGANCVVEIDDRDDKRLTIVVTNDGQHAPDPGPGSGFGLVGMRERADLVDADLNFGATNDGGWRVQLTIKRDPT